MKLKEYTLFITEPFKNKSDLLIVVDYEIIAFLPNCIMRPFRDGFGANKGVYAETSGGYAGQIHGAAYLSDGSVMYASNLEPYECDCDECSEKGYEDSTCKQKDWSQIEYMDSFCDKLYWIDDHMLGHYTGKKHTQVLKFLAKHIDAEILQENFAPTPKQINAMLGDAVRGAK